MRRWALAVGGVATAGSLSVWLATGWWPHRLPVAQPIVVDRAFEDHADTLRRGEPLSALFDALHDAIPDSVLPRAEVNRFISDLADDVFGWEIDFSRDVTGGDRFHLAFERLGSSLDDVRYGRLIAARIETRGVASTAYLL